MHELGIRHGDVHEGNILVTADDAVFLLDFGACVLDLDDWELDGEQRSVTFLMSLPPQVRRHSALPLLRCPEAHRCFSVLPAT